MEEPIWFLFRGSDLLLSTESACLPEGAAVALPERRQFVGQLGERPCYAAELPAERPAPAGMEFLGLRAVYTRVPLTVYRMAARAVQLVEFDRTHRFCGACGGPTVVDGGARACPACQSQVFPRLSPAVIVLIKDGDRTLLARSHRFPPGRYSTLAGFVEPGETLEEAVEREVLEEVGVRVKNVRYFGSQPWPFPHSLMVGFTADYAGGELRLQEDEIADAQWFDVANLPDVPPPISIARKLIDAFVEERRRPG